MQERALFLLSLVSAKTLGEKQAHGSNERLVGGVELAL